MTCKLDGRNCRFDRDGNCEFCDVKRPKFFEGLGGEIIGPSGHVVARVMVDNLTTADAGRVMRTLVESLNKEFSK